MTLAAVSKHIRVLERAGLVARRREGRTHHVSAKPETVIEARRWIEQYVQEWDHSFDALEQFLAEKHGRPSERPKTID